MPILKSILNALFPESFTCELCGREIFDESHLCADCKKTVEFNDGITCPVCGRRTKVAQLCIDCKAYAPYFNRAVSPLVYSEGVKKLIHAYKDDRPYLKEYFAQLMAQKCAVFDDAEAIVYVPMTRKAIKRRGYNQAKLLAYSLSKRINLPVLKEAIIKKKDTVQQKSLSRREREENLSGCFKADKKAVEGKVLILVDDVMTTGATSNAVCNELIKRGVKKIYFVTVASVEYKGEL